jgi:hypothetical protein
VVVNEVDHSAGAVAAEEEPDIVWRMHSRPQSRARPSASTSHPHFAQIHPSPLGLGSGRRAPHRGQVANPTTLSFRRFRRKYTAINSATVLTSKAHDIGSMQFSGSMDFNQ